MAKLWQKDYSVDKLVERFTVGADHLLDQELVLADCVASFAHAAMLASIKVLTQTEHEKITAALKKIITLKEKGSFPLTVAGEDCHTAIENFLVKEIGEAGKKIHTGRSRNDQVLTALRVYTREHLLLVQGALLTLADAFVSLARKNEFVPMPGRTHMQIAMPSSIGLWAAGFAEALVDDYDLIDTAYRINDQCPLGSAASYGVPLPLDREMTSSLLGFKKVQRNVLYANNSRGKIEAVVLDSVDQLMLSLSKQAEDLILYSMPEFGYFSLPPELCTGSSIMPQKKNPDLLELIRAKSAMVTGLTVQVKGVIRALPSGYNRDFQETKGPLITGMKTGLDSLRVMQLAVESLHIHKEKLLKGFVPEIFATDAAFDLVREGTSFRDAYRKVAAHPDTLSEYRAEEVLRLRVSTGAPGNLQLDQIEEIIEHNRTELEAKRRQTAVSIRLLLGEELRLVDP